MASFPPADSVALVGAAASDIGRACLERLERDGQIPVAGWHRSTVDHPRAVRFDTTVESEVEEAVDLVEDRWGPIATVVCGAGAAHLGLAIRIPSEPFRQIVDLNLTGAFLLARAVASRMMSRRYGRIILIGSTAGLFGEAGLSPYSSSKAALEGLAMSMAREMGGRGITVNVVAPGLLDHAGLTLDRHRPPGTKESWLAATPLGRLGTPAEIAAVVAFLASNAGAAITGAVLPVDGGISVPSS